MATSRHLMLLVVACTLAVLFIGSAEAVGCNGGECEDRPHSNPSCEQDECVYECEYGWGNCDSDDYNGCETGLNNDVNNCGWCGNVCTTTREYAEAYCKHGHCKQRCMHGYWYNRHSDQCVERNHH